MGDKMEFVFIQIIGFIGYSILALSYFKKSKKEILFLEIIAYIMFTIHYYLLNGITGAICNFVGLIALIFLYLFDKTKYKKILAYFFVIALIIINIITFQNIYSIFPMIASTIVIISFLMTENEIRKIGIIAAICWLIYAIIYKSYIAIIFEVLTLISVVVAFIKNKRKY